MKVVQCSKILAESVFGCFKSEQFSRFEVDAVFEDLAKFCKILGQNKSNKIKNK